MAKLVPELSVITLIQDDLDAAKAFYQKAFGLQVLFEDQDSALFRFGGTFVNLLKRSAAQGILGPAPLAEREAGARCQFTIPVDDVDDRCVRLRQAGVELLNGPMNRPWGMRTAAFQDPFGHIWELAQDL